MTPPPARSRPRRRAPAAVLRSVRSALAVLTVLAVPAGLMLVATPAAWAHSSLISSSPAADSVLATPPTRIELVFNEQIRDFQPKIAITVGDHDPIEVTPVIDGATVSADLTGVSWPGGTGSTSGSGTGSTSGTGSDGAATAVAWKVGYRVVSADGHPVSGLVPFSVGDGPAPTAGSAATPTAPAGVADTGGSGSATTDEGLPVWAWVAIAVVAVAAVAAGLVLLRRRRPTPGPAAAAGDLAAAGDGADDEAGGGATGTATGTAGGGATGGPGRTAGGAAGGRGPVPPAEGAGR